MRHFFILLLISFFISGCGGSSSGTDFEVIELPVFGWFVTSPDTNLSQYSSVNIKVTFTNNHSTSDMTFNSSPQFQLWSNPDVYDFVAAGDITITSEPSGIVGPGGNYSYDLTVDLSNVPANQMHLALRPVDNNLFGTISPPNTSVVTSEVTFVF